GGDGGGCAFCADQLGGGGLGASGFLHALRCRTMSERIGRLLAAGNVAEVFGWGPRPGLKLYRSATAKPTVLREAGTPRRRKRWGFPFLRSGACSRSTAAGASSSTGCVGHRLPSRYGEVRRLYRITSRFSLGCRRAFMRAGP